MWINKRIKNLAILGGTFDPIHTGHLIIAEAVRDKLKMDGVLFIPTGTPPHKKFQTITADKHRYKMVLKAISTNKDFYISDIEMKREGNSYTIDTIRQIKEISPEINLYFITGVDAIELIDSWKDASTLINTCKFIVLKRPGYGMEILKKAFEKIEADYSQLIFVDTPLVEISSSEIRRRVACDESIQYLLPQEVEEYIYEKKLYRCTRKC